MGYGIKLRVWGEYACFTRPEMKVERVSYDVMTPSAARGILTAIHWKPEIEWRIDKIYVLKPIVFTNIRRNELKDKIGSGTVKKAINNPTTRIYMNIQDPKNRTQRASMILRNVEYIIEAHFETTGSDRESDVAKKHYNIFRRRVLKGQCFHRPYFGNREFPVHFSLVNDDDNITTIEASKDLGWMLYDIDFSKNMAPRFFKAELVAGTVTLPSWEVVMK